MADLLATSPFVNPGNGYQARRLTLAVIRDDDGTPREFVVQRQCVDETGKATFQSGSWMPVFSRDPEEVRVTAWERFMERAREDAHLPLSNLREQRFANHLVSLTVDTGKG